MLKYIILLFHNFNVRGFKNLTVCTAVFVLFFPTLTPSITFWHVDVNVRSGDSLKAGIVIGRGITAN